MKIGVLKCDQEPLVPVIPPLVQKLLNEGFEVSVEKGAGEASLYTDEQFTEAGAKVLERNEALKNSDILLTVASLPDSDIKLARKDAVLIGNFNSRREDERIKALRESNLQVFSLDLLPRSTLAQPMDVLSSLNSLAGYKAVIMAAEKYPGYFPMMTTAAGTIPPAKVLVLGAGVAGLQAIATARRLGASVEAFDVRTAVKEEVESLGAKFIEVEGSAEDEKAGGYAVEQSEDFVRRQKELIHQKAIKADVIIATANIPGKKAPLLIEEDTVLHMQPGSVIVDLASETGGNCAVSENEKEINYHGVTVIGDSRLHITMPKKASRLYANNIYNFLKFMFKDKEQPISFEHEIVRDTYLGDSTTN